MCVTIPLDVHCLGRQQLRELVVKRVTNPDRLSRNGYLADWPNETINTHIQRRRQFGKIETVGTGFFPRSKTLR